MNTREIWIKKGVVALWWEFCGILNCLPTIYHSLKQWQLWSCCPHSVCSLHCQKEHHESCSQIILVMCSGLYDGILKDQLKVFHLFHLTQSIPRNNRLVLKAFKGKSITDSWGKREEIRQAIDISKTQEERGWGRRLVE